MSASVDSLLARMADAERRLAEHAAQPLPAGMTEPDELTNEQWEAGQVWAHLAEFPGYWLGQVQRVIAQPTHGAIPFGRVRTDANRIESIERERHTDPAALLQRTRASLAEIGDAMRSWAPETWRLRGAHPTLGEMTVERMVDEFIVTHLEEHADQLDSLRSSAATNRG
jgi:hypothetical protein